MNFYKGKGATVSFITALLALVGVQAYAFSHSNDPDDSFQPATAAVERSSDAPAAEAASEASDDATAADTTAAVDPSSPTSDPSVQPQITGGSLDDDDEDEEEDEDEDEDETEDDD